MALASYLVGGEFLEEIEEGIESSPYRGISENDPGFVEVGRRVVIVRDRSGRQERGESEVRTGLFHLDGFSKR